jgi:hypothetical protein
MVAQGIHPHVRCAFVVDAQRVPSDHPDRPLAGAFL